MREVIAGKYELLEEIGQGAGGTYQARDTELDTIVAVTVRSEDVADDPERLARFEGRVHQACELRHEHIVPVLGLARDTKPPLVVEAAIDAPRLEQVLRERGAFSPVDALQVARQLADALAYAHERGVIHGGLTPAAVFIQETVPPRALLAAFGGGLDGGPGAVPPILLPYAAPERLKGKEQDARIDVFALGLVLFEMLEGKQFFDGADARALTDLLLGGSAPLVPQFSRILPPGVPALVARMIRRSPAKRQQSMAQVRSELDAFLPRVAPIAPGPRMAKAPAAPATTTTVVPCETRKRVTVQMPALDAQETSHAPTPEPILARQVLTRASTTHRRIPRAGAALIAAVVVALGWPLVRSVRTAPAASERLSAAASATPPREATAARPTPGNEDRGLVRAEPSAAFTTPSPEVGVAQEPSVAATDPDAETASAYAGHRDDTSAAEASNSGPSKLCPPPDVAPRIVGYQPRRRDPLGVTEGAPVDFSVRATDKDPGDPITYAWFLDGRRVGQRPGWRFVPPPASVAATHTVEARVSDGVGQQAPRLTWRVEVRPRMTEVNVRDWLARLAGAWERKDVATLRLYGVVTTDAEATALRKRLGQSDRYRVSIANESIRTQGQHATVAFDRTELDGRGRTVSSRRESYELEKRPDGFIGLRPPATSR